PPREGTRRPETAPRKTTYDFYHGTKILRKLRYEKMSKINFNTAPTGALRHYVPWVLLYTVRKLRTL
ncbi:hypothetical protein, partial [Bacteroides faecis]|uniref:hypothetical protein n=1 Tax=Bacteroides faecis TaxID=674529 RepID=UPI0019502BDD